MGQVLELRQKISTDWTVVERLQLDTLVSRSARAWPMRSNSGSDAATPGALCSTRTARSCCTWRIAGRFYVHSTVEPFVAESRDLPTAVAALHRRQLPAAPPCGQHHAALRLVMPLHAYAMPSEMPVEPRAEMLDERRPAAVRGAGRPTWTLPEAPEPLVTRPLHA